MAWVLREGALRATTTSGADLVKELGKCVYTALRTYKGKPVSLGVHVERLRRSARETGAPEPDPNAIASTVREASAALPAGADAVITIATSPSGLVAHIRELPALPAPPVKAVVTPVERKYGEVKDSAWILEREALQWPPGVNELLIMSPDGSLLEGASSNVFVVRGGGVIQTAGENILSGSIRRLVLRAAGEHGIPVDLSPPNWGERESWEAAFITSTSRLVLPLDEVYQVGGASRPLPSDHPVVAKLQAAVQAALDLEASYDLSATPDSTADPLV